MFGIKGKMVNHIYRKKNKHNYTKLARYVNLSLIDVGKGSYGKLDVITHSGINGKLKIGNYCSIADDVVFMLGGEHYYKGLSTYPFKKMYLDIPESKTKGDIIIEDDVWIGYNATILSGVTIGQGAIIGAKSIVTHDIPPYAIYCGNRIVKYRFSKKIIDKLKLVDYSKIDLNFIKDNIELLYTEITEENIDELLEKISLIS